MRAIVEQCLVVGLLACAGCSSQVYAPDELATTQVERSAGGPMMERFDLGRRSAHGLGVVAGEQVSAVALRALERPGSGADVSYAVDATFGDAAPEMVAVVHVDDDGLEVDTPAARTRAKVVGIAAGLEGAAGGKALGYPTMDAALQAVSAADASQ